MFTKIGTISIGVSDQDKALDFYVNKLGFEKIDDQPMSETERWLEVAPPGAQTHIMLGLRVRVAATKLASPVTSCTPTISNKPVRRSKPVGSLFPKS